MTRLDSLTSLRFAAAFLVFGFHLSGMLGEESSGISKFIFGSGPSGVTFFFILSGFVMGWSMRAGDSAGAFLRRRFARIYPAYLVALIFAAAVLFVSNGPGALQPGVGTPFLLQSWIPSKDYFHAINVPAWSLSCEFFFYLTFPLFAPRIARFDQRRRLRLAAAMLTVIVALGVYGTIFNPTFRDDTLTGWFVQFFPPARLPEFILGICLAEQLRKGRFPNIGLGPALLLTGAALLVSGTKPGMLGLVVLPCIPFVLLIAAAAYSDLDRRNPWLRSRTLVHLGAWSYCFYLLHVTMYRAITGQLHRFGIEVHDQPLQGWPLWLAILAATVAASWALHVIVERPLDQLLRLPNEPRPVAVQD